MSNRKSVAVACCAGICCCTAAVADPAPAPPHDGRFHQRACARLVQSGQGGCGFRPLHIRAIWVEVQRLLGVINGTGYSGQADTPLLGVHDGRAIYLLYNGILKDKSIDGGNVLTGPVLDILPSIDGPKVIYAAACRFGAPRLQRSQVVFVIENGVAHAKQVKTGIQSDTHIELLEGVAAAEQVVTGSYRAISRDLKEGAKVKVDAGESHS